MHKFKSFLIGSSFALLSFAYTPIAYATSRYTLQEIARLYAEEVCAVAKRGINPSSKEGVKILLTNLTTKYGYDYMDAFVKTEDSFNQLALKYAINSCPKELIELYAD